MSSSPPLSIGLPVRNGEPYLDLTLKCLAAQEFDDLEVLIADNGSTDNTEEIARAAAASDPRIRYVRHPENIGVAANFNYVFANTSGEFFAWLAADDEFDPRFYVRMVELLQRRPEAASAMSRVGIIDEEGRRLPDADEPVNADVADPVHRFSEMASFRHWCQYSFAVSRRTAMEQTRLLLPFWSSDRLFCAELALAGPLIREPEALFRIRQHQARVTKRAGRNDWEVMKFYLTPSGSRAMTLHYAGRLREAVQRSQLTPADKRRAYAALVGWGVQNAGKLGRSLGRATLEAVTQPYAQSKRRAAEEAQLSGSAPAGRSPSA